MRIQDEAQRALADAGLQMAVVEQPTGASPGIVLQQDPAPGTQVLRNSSVRLVVEAPRATVPNLLGATRANAQALLAGSNLQVGNVGEQLTGSPPVLARRPAPSSRRTPGPGTPVLRGTAVRLVLQASTVVVPDVRGRSQSDAQSVLLSGGLQVGQVSPRETRAPPSGTVLEQGPVPGSHVPVRSPVHLVVAATPQPVYGYEDFIVHRYAAPGTFSGNCSNVQDSGSANHVIAAGWTIDRSRGDGGHACVSEIDVGDNQQSMNTLREHNYYAADDVTVQVEGRICGASAQGAGAIFRRTYRVYTVQP